jgi:chemotaxis signal transduction protein
VSETSSEILLFQVGARAYASAVYDVLRIETPSGEGGDQLVSGSVLGRPFSPDRGIVVDCGDGTERTLVVDHVIGVRSVPQEDVRPLPPLAAECLASSAITGFALLDEVPTLLVDLPTLLREQRSGSSAGPEGKERNDA